MSTGYINGLYGYPQQGQYAQSFGMTPAQQTNPQFAGIPTPQTVGSPEAESSLMSEIFNPFSLVFLPLTLMDENVKKYIKNSANASGVNITKSQKHKVFGKSVWFDSTPIQGAPKTTISSRWANLGKELKGVNYSEIGKKSIESLYSKNNLYRSLAKEGKSATEIFDIVHKGKGLSVAETAAKTAEIGNVTKGITKSTNFFAKAVQKLGTGTIGKALRGIPGSAILFGAFEIPNVISATKYGTGETIKQVGRSTLNAAGNVIAFTAGTEAGAAAGAALGTVICPGIGTVIGGAIGGLVGGIVASHVVGKVTKSIGETIFGKPKAEQEEKQQALLAQQQAAAQQQIQYQQQTPQSFNPYTSQRTSFQGMGAMTGSALANNGLSLGDENMLANSMSAYNMYQYA